MSPLDGHLRLPVLLVSFCFLRLVRIGWAARGLSGAGGSRGWRGVLGLVVLDGLTHMREEVGLEAVEALAVVPLHDDGAEDEPEEQAERGGQGSPGKADVALGTEVHDRPGPGQDLAERR